MSEGKFYLVGAMPIFTACIRNSGNRCSKMSRMYTKCYWQTFASRRMRLPTNPAPHSKP